METGTYICFHWLNERATSPLVENRWSFCGSAHFSGRPRGGTVVLVLWPVSWPNTAVAYQAQRLHSLLEDHKTSDVTLRASAARVQPYYASSYLWLRITTAVDPDSDGHHVYTFQVLKVC